MKSEWLIQYSDELWAGWWGFSFWQGKYFLFDVAFRPALGPTQLPVKWVPWVLFPGVQWQECEVDNSLSSSAKVKNGGTIFPLPHMSSQHGHLYLLPLTLRTVGDYRLNCQLIPSMSLNGIVLEM
jgi:hypothetical protein